MKSNPGVAAKMFSVLADNGVNISMISTSAIRVSVVIEGDKTELATRSLHTAFGLDSEEVFEETQLSGEELAAKIAKGR
jgi:aspartate kinase